jgi:TPR repeat protein
LGVKQDYAEAMAWYRKAADQGDATAQSLIGWLYEKGQGVSKDCDQAKAWYQKAADQGLQAGRDGLARVSG